MLTVHKFVADWGLSDMSPFCIKLETWLRMAKIPYRTAVGNPRSAPKKKLPYITDEDGRTIADSDAIIRHLKHSRGVTLDAHLDARTLAVGEAFRALLEDRLYFVVLYLRWCTPDGLATYRPTLTRYFDALKVPRVLQRVIIRMEAGAIRQQLERHGIGRHSLDELTDIGTRGWTTVADQLGDQPFFLGDRPTSVDATIYAFLVSIIETPFDGPLKQHALAGRRVVAYRDRMRELYWP